MIRENVQRLFSELHGGVDIVAAVKGRSHEEILEAIDAGIKIIGENYVQEAEGLFNVIDSRIKWHFIGHLQKNKVKKAVKIFDMIETVDSLELAEEIDKVCSREGKIMQVMVEVNSGREMQKYGVIPEDIEDFVKRLAGFRNIKVTGLMTMAPMFGNPEDVRPYFVETRKMFEKIKSMDIENVEIKYLSMGMSNSYNIAIEEGANIVRIGSGIFK